MDLKNKILLNILAPLRYAVRHELKRAGAKLEIEIEKRLNACDLFHSSLRVAHYDSAKYVSEKLYNAKVYNTPEEVWDFAIDCANLDKTDVALEFGVASGYSINYLAERVPCTIFGYDSFEGLPETWRSGFESGMFKMEKVPDTLPNVILKKGLFSETLETLHNETTDVKLVHVDCDLYSSTVTIFEKIGNLMSPGCVLIFDEYLGFPGWRNCEYLAFQEFIEKNNRSYEYLAYNRNHEQVVIRLID